MPRRRFSLVLPVVIGVIATPAALSWAYYHFTGDPTLRPLGVTLNSLRQRRIPGFGAGITVEILWGEEAASPHDPQQVELALDKALRPYDVDYLIRITPAPGNRILAYFDVGANRLGPYGLADIASGIPPAIEALRME